MKQFLMILFAFAVLFPILAYSADEPKRKAELDEMLKVFPKYEAWEQWLKDTGELPPDFDSLPSIR